MAMAVADDKLTGTCRYCDTAIPTPVVGPGMVARGALLLHERACVRRSTADRNHFRQHRRWPPRTTP